MNETVLKGYLPGAIGRMAELHGTYYHRNWGLGFGNRLMEEAISFCKKGGYRRIYLNTFEGLHPARHLYEKFGFKLIEQAEGMQWGTKVIEQKFELIL
jgi:GNAT superfamily N-acetyltransferase